MLNAQPHFLVVSRDIVEDRKQDIRTMKETFKRLPASGNGVEDRMERWEEWK